MTERAFILSRNLRTRQSFDPSNAEHRSELRFFVKNRRWENGCPFFLEEDYADIPSMCNARFLEYITESTV